MSKIYDTFGRHHVVLPVIHFRDRRAAWESIEVCVGEGADGLFFINQGIDAVGAIELATLAKSHHPRSWVGLNLLDHGREETLSLWDRHGLFERLDGLWRDDAGVVVRSLPGGLDPTAEVTIPLRAMDFLTRLEERAPRCLYFGGAAFKGQPTVPASHWGDCARAAARVAHVVTTSGDATGHATPIEKVRAMRASIGPSVGLAVASGSTPETVATYLEEGVHAFIVATHIEEGFGQIRRARLRAFLDTVRAFEGRTR